MTASITFTFDEKSLIQGIDGVIGAISDSVRPSSQSGSQIIYDEARFRVPVSKRGHWFHGTSFKKHGTKYWFDSGSLRDAIYQVYSKDNSSKMKAEYHIAWNHQKVPYGFMVEFGTSNAPAHPFLGPSYTARAEDVKIEMENRMIDELEKRIGKS